MNDNTSAPRVVVLGIDAGDPDLLEQFMRAGHLPTLSRLATHGRYARTTGPELLCEHGAWISILSGVSRREHGFHFFRQLKSGTYDIELARGADLHVKPLWCHLPKHSQVLIIDAPDTPPQTDVGGRHLSEWATHSHYPPIPLRASPSTLLADAEHLSGPREVISEELEASPARDQEIVERLIQRVARKGALTRGLMRAESADFVLSVFAESHTGAHQAWEYRRNAKGSGVRSSKTADARPDNAQMGDAPLGDAPLGDAPLGDAPLGDAPLGDALLHLYQAIDCEIGTLVDHLPPETTVFVLGSVGLRSQYPTEELALNVCRALDYQRDATTGPQHGFSAMGLLRRVLPQSVRTLLSKGLSLDRQAQLESEKFRISTDWSTTRAFALPGYYSSAIRLNLRGREPQGIVNPGDAAALCDQIERDFLSLLHAETRQPVVERVVRLYDESAYGSHAHGSLPDLLVIWREHERPIRAVCATTAEGIERQITQARHAFHRGSDHSTEGFVIASGGRIKPNDGGGYSPAVSPLSIAPTILEAMGAEIPPSMTARPLGWM